MGKDRRVPRRRSSDSRRRARLVTRRSEPPARDHWSPGASTRPGTRIRTALSRMRARCHAAARPSIRAAGIRRPESDERSRHRLRRWIAQRSREGQLPGFRQSRPAGGGGFWTEGADRTLTRVGAILLTIVGAIPLTVVGAIALTVVGAILLRRVE